MSTDTRDDTLEQPLHRNLPRENELVSNQFQDGEEFFFAGKPFFFTTAYINQ
jgi:hypothetical protein